MKKLRNIFWQWRAQFVVAACALLIPVVGVPAKAPPEDYWKALQAIARDIARIHGGDIALSESRLGGLRAVLKVPV